MKQIGNVLKVTKKFWRNNKKTVKSEFISMK